MAQQIDTVLTALKAAADPTRLRLLALCLHDELTVSELVQILGQSQPRVSRHLKLLTDAGLLERFREGSWVFHRLADGGASNGLAGDLASLLPQADETLLQDRHRLAAVKQARSDEAALYFRDNAAGWDRLRSLHVDEAEVEKRVLSLLPESGIGDLLDLGTGTGRMLELLAGRIRRGQGLDLSHDMLTVARANLERAGLDHCQVRQGDIYRLPFADGSFDAITIHQVLHFLDQPATALAEAARVLRPGGHLLLVDFAPHQLEELRAEHNHRRLGFADKDVEAWLQAAHLQQLRTEVLPGNPLTVTVWLAACPEDGRPNSQLAKEQS